DLPVPPVGDRLVLPGRRLPPLPRRLGGLPGTAAPRRRRRGGPLRRLRPRGRLPPPAALWRARDRTRRRAGVDHVGVHHVDAAPPRAAAERRPGPVRAGLRPHREPLLRPRLVPAGCATPRPDGPHRLAAGSARPRSLRRGVPGVQRVGPARGMAGLAVAHRPRRRARDDRAGDHAPPARGDRQLPTLRRPGGHDRPVRARQTTPKCRLNATVAAWYRTGNRRTIRSIACASGPTSTRARRFSTPSRITRAAVDASVLANF